MSPKCIGETCARVCLLTVVVSAITAEQERGIPDFFGGSTVSTLPLRRYVRAGHVNIGLHVPIFSRDQDNVCRNYNYLQGTVLLVIEAFLFSLRAREKHGYLLESESGVNASLGYTILDSCRSELQLARNVLDTAGPFCANTSDDKCTCASCQENDPCHDNDEVDNSGEMEALDVFRGKVAAVLGPTTGGWMIGMSPLFSALKIPHVISPGPGMAGETITCPKEDRHCAFQYDYLFQASASQGHIFTAILDVLKTFSWLDFVVLAEDPSTLNQFLHTLGSYNMKSDRRLCVAFNASLPSNASDDIQLDRIVSSLEKHNQSQVVVMIADVPPAKSIFKHIVQRHTSGARQRIPRVWVATDWGKDYSIYEDENIRNATLETLIRLWADVPRPFQDWIWSQSEKFAHYLSNQTAEDVAEQTHNPWLCLNWGTALNCSGLCGQRFQDVCHTHSHQICPTGGAQCNPNETVPVPVNQLYYTAVPHTLFATEVLIYAFKSLWEEAGRATMNKSSTAHLLEFISLTNNDTLKEALIDVSLPCTKDNQKEGLCSVFSNNTAVHEPEPVFTLLTSKANNRADVEKIGTWEMKNGQGEVHLVENHRALMRWGELELDIVTGYAISNCKRPCRKGAFQVKQNSQSCCTSCILCTGNRIIEAGNCLPCPTGTKAENTTHCAPLPKGRSPAYNISLILSATLGSLLTVPIVATLLLLVYKRKSVAIKAADRKLSSVIIISMLGSIGSTFVQYLTPSTSTCAIGRLVLLPWILLTVTAMFVKTTRIARFWMLARKGAATPTSWTYSTPAQIVFTVVLMLIGESLEFGMLLELGADVEQMTTTTHTYLLCKPGIDELVIDIYIILLLVATSGCAFTMRKMPTIANESRNLFLASFCMTATWMLLTPMYYLSSDHRPTILSLRTIGHVLSLWAWIFIPRLYMLKDSEVKLTMSRSKSLEGPYTSVLISRAQLPLLGQPRKVSDCGQVCVDSCRSSIEHPAVIWPRKLSAQSEAEIDYHRKATLSPTVPRFLPVVSTACMQPGCAQINFQST